MLSEAAGSFFKEDRPVDAHTCMLLMRLTALQVQLADVKLINLTPAEVDAFMLAHHLFTESYIVAEAYDRTDPTHWVKPLVHQGLIEGDARYVDEFLHHVAVPDSFFFDVVDEFFRHPESPLKMVHAEMLLDALPDLVLRYRLASLMGLADYLHTLFAHCPYLQDYVI